MNVAMNGVLDLNLLRFGRIEEEADLDLDGVFKLNTFCFESTLIALPPQTSRAMDSESVAEEVCFVLTFFSLRFDCSIRSILNLCETDIDGADDEEEELEDLDPDGVLKLNVLLRIHSHCALCRHRL